MEGAQLTLSAELLAELLKLVGRISLSRETDTRKERGRVDARQWNKHIIYSYGTAFAVIKNNSESSFDSAGFASIASVSRDSLEGVPPVLTS